VLDVAAARNARLGNGDSADCLHTAMLGGELYHTICIINQCMRAAPRREAPAGNSGRPGLLRGERGQATGRAGRSNSRGTGRSHLVAVAEPAGNGDRPWSMRGERGQATGQACRKSRGTGQVTRRHIKQSACLPNQNGRWARQIIPSFRN
jgi:hypothetical protein